MIALALIATLLGIGVPGSVAQQVNGTRPFLALMCTFADNAETYGFTTTQIDNMLTGSPYSLDGYVREMSMGAMNLAGSRAAGWFPLGKPRTAYTPDFPGAGAIAEDCAAAAMAGGVNFGPYRDLMVFLNDQLPGAEGRWFPVTLTVGGQATRYDVVMITRRGLTSPPLVLHELGHVFGGKHTSSYTDPLGGGSTYGDRPERPVNGVALRTVNIGPGWDASNRDAAGWVPADRKVNFASGTQTVTLTRLTQPGPTGAMLVNVPIGATGARYVVSARTRVGYDAQTKFPNTLQFGYVVPEPGVVIERVSPTQDTTTMFSTPGGNPESAAAVWKPGQTYTDDAAGIRITIDRFDDNGAQITVTGPGAAPAVTTTTAPPAPVTTAAPATTAPAAVTTVPAPVTTPPPATAPPATTPAPAGQGASNDLASAPLLTVPGTITGVSTATATNEPGETQPCAGIGATVWLRFTVPASGSFTVDTAGSNFDTVAAVYRGSAPFASLAPIACNDDPATGTQAAVTGQATPGETLYVQLGGYGSATGSLSVSVR